MLLLHIREDEHLVGTDAPPVAEQAQLSRSMYKPVYLTPDGLEKLTRVCNDVLETYVIESILQPLARTISLK